MDENPPGPLIFHSSNRAYSREREVVVAKSGTTFAKRQKEMAQQERARDKVAKRVERGATKEKREVGPDGEDPDIAGIIPGPQPIPDEDY